MNATADLTLFDLDEPTVTLGKTLRELHSGLTAGTARSWTRAGYCGHARWDWHPNPETGWYGVHICTRPPGHHGDCTCDRCDRTWPRTTPGAAL